MPHNERRMRAVIAGGLVAPLVMLTGMLGVAQRPPAPILNAASTDGFETIVKPFLSAHCVTCHGHETHKRELNFEAFTSVSALVDHRDRWEEVVRKLRDREMPPDEEPQPSEHQRQAVAAWLARELARIDRLTPPDPGRVTARRLNRAEYNNTVRDLLGVDTRPADEFPQDDSGYGFDNIADVLSLSPALMEKYMTAAERVARTALFGVPPMTPTLTRLRSEGRRSGDARVVPAQYDLTGLSLPNAFHAAYRAPADADYVVRVGLGGLRPAGSAPITVTLWADGREVASLAFDAETSARFDDDQQDFGGQAVQFRIRLSSGDHDLAAAIPRIYEGLPARYGGPNPSPRDVPRKPFNPPARRIGRTDRGEAQGVRREASRAAEDSAQWRAREHGGRRRTLRAGHRSIPREQHPGLQLRPQERRAHGDVCDTYHDDSCRTRVPPPGRFHRGREVRGPRAAGAAG